MSESSSAGPDSDLVEHFQRVMQRFLDVEEAVVLERLGAEAAQDAQAADRPPLLQTAPAALQQAVESPARDAGLVRRFVLRPVALLPATGSETLSRSGEVVVVDDGQGVAAALTGLLDAAGYRWRRFETAAAALTSVATGSDISAVVDLSALRPAPDGDMGEGSSRGVEALFELLKAAKDGLERLAANGGAAMLAAVSMGGTFGADGTDFVTADGAVAGLLKAVAQEWPSVRVRALDLAADAPGALAARVFAELMSSEMRVEVGYRADGSRIGLNIVPARLPRLRDPASLPSEAVILVTGGARGITAEVCIALAAAARPALVLVGRTPAPDADEPAATASLTDERQIKGALFEGLRAAGLPARPSEIESAYRTLVAEREIRLSLAAIRAAGAEVTYVACDVRDNEAFGAAIDAVYARFGRIDGVIHAAGVIEDRLIGEKSLDSFRRVYETKVNGASTLVRKLRPEALSFFVLFSSVTARFGNRGQSDYAAANEVLNKLAQKLDRSWQGRVVAVDWGPWGGAGMVSAEAERQFAERGVGLIPKETGCEMLLDEVFAGAKGEAELVIAALPDAAAPFISVTDPAPARELQPATPSLPLLHADTQAYRDEAGAFVVARTLSPAHDIFLMDHVLDGHPVLPFAGALELMAEVAQAGWPSHQVVGLRNVRALRGIVLEGTEAPLLIRAGAAAPNPGSGAELIEITIAPAAQAGRLHYTGTVEMAQRPLPAPAAAIQPVSGQLGMSVAGLYREWLFHGPMFQAVLSVEALDANGVSARLRPSVAATCIHGASGDWLCDPVLVDAAFQLVLIWGRANWDITVLPSSLGSLRPLAGNPTVPVRCEIRLRPESREPICNFDIYLFDETGRCTARFDDFQAVGTKALNRLAGGGRQ